VQAIFLAGRNEELRADAEFLAETAQFPVKVIGYSEHVEQLMGAANVMISKLGGLTTFEALACRLPIIADAITKPMPQEAGTASLVVNRGAGILLKRAVDIVPVIRRMVEDTAHYSGDASSDDWSRDSKCYSSHRGRNCCPDSGWQTKRQIRPRWPKWCRSDSYRSLSLVDC
jgi:UDP-N-acetylglucosamine:LPS N-acetylglucosamine transferase